MKRLPVIITSTSYLLNIPAIFIWVAIILRVSKIPIGESMTIWLTANFSVLAILAMWLMFPSSALIFGLGGYMLEAGNFFTIPVIALSTILLLGLLIVSANAIL